MKNLVLSFLLLNVLNANAQNAKTQFQQVTDVHEQERVQSFSALRQRSIVETQTQKQIGQTQDTVVRKKTTGNSLLQQEATELSQEEELQKNEILKSQLLRLLKGIDSGKTEKSEAMERRSTVPYYNDQQLLAKVAVTDQATSAVSSFDVSAFPLFEQETKHVPLASSFESELILQASLKPSDVEKVDVSFGSLQLSHDLNATVQVSTNTPKEGDQVFAYTYQGKEKDLKLLKAELVVERVLSNDGELSFLLAGLESTTNVENSIFVLNKEGEYLGFVKKKMLGKTAQLIDFKSNSEDKGRAENASYLVLQLN